MVDYIVLEDVTGTAYIYGMMVGGYEDVTSSGLYGGSTSERYVWHLRSGSQEISFSPTVSYSGKSGDITLDALLTVPDRSKVPPFGRKMDTPPSLHVPMAVERTLPEPGQPHDGRDPCRQDFHLPHQQRGYGRLHRAGGCHRHRLHLRYDGGRI